jgi:hypothetical protein
MTETPDEAFEYTARVTLTVHITVYGDIEEAKRVLDEEMYDYDLLRYPVKVIHKEIKEEDNNGRWGVTL